jgi:hypothetical protein
MASAQQAPSIPFLDNPKSAQAASNFDYNIGDRVEVDLSPTYPGTYTGTIKETLVLPRQTPDKRAAYRLTFDEPRPTPKADQLVLVFHEDIVRKLGGRRRKTRKVRKVRKTRKH